MEFPLTPLYVNSLLANLNVRDYVRGVKADVEYNSFPLDNLCNTALGRRSGSGSQVCTAETHRLNALAEPRQMAEGFRVQTMTNGHVTAFDSDPAVNSKLRARTLN